MPVLLLADLFLSGFCVDLTPQEWSIGSPEQCLDYAVNCLRMAQFLREHGTLQGGPRQLVLCTGGRKKHHCVWLAGRAVVGIAQGGSPGNMVNLVSIVHVYACWVWSTSSAHISVPKCLLFGQIASYYMHPQADMQVSLRWQ